MTVCPKCASESVIKYGKARAKQRYKCARCGCQFLAGAAVRHDLDEKLSAMSMLASGLSLHAVAKIFSVSVQTVWRWKNSGLIAHEQVWSAYQDYKTALASYTINRDVLASAQENERVSHASYRAGKETLLNLLTVQAQLASARQELIVSFYTVLISKASLYRAIGKF